MTGEPIADYEDEMDPAGRIGAALANLNREPIAGPASRYPGIKRAALEIAYDNGGIHRERSEKRMLREFGNWLERQPSELLSDIDRWLSALTEADLQTVCAGEASEADALLASSPPFTNQLLNAYFDEVC